jgi:hypothetical protein
MARNKTKKNLREARAEAMLFFVLAELFPKATDSEILDQIEFAKGLLTEWIGANI